MLKHVGRHTKSKRKVVVAYKVVPGESENCICVTTENLNADEHDSLMKLVESDAGQQSSDLADAMARTRLPDGRIMLSAFHTTGKLVKMQTNQIEMTPNRNSTVLLSELNQIIAQQKGVTVEDLAQTPGQSTEPVVNNSADTTAVAEAASTSDVLTDEDLAAQYRSQADAMFKEAKRLREQAEELVPTKKKAKKEETSV